MYLLPCPGTPGKWFLLYLKSELSNAIREMMAACSALEVTLYVSKDCEMYLAACFAVAHSPLAGGLSHVLEFGEMLIIWASVTAVSCLKKDEGIGAALERIARVSRREAVRVVCHIVC